MLIPGPKGRAHVRVNNDSQYPDAAAAPETNAASATATAADASAAAAVAIGDASAHAIWRFSGGGGNGGMKPFTAHAREMQVTGMGIQMVAGGREGWNKKLVVNEGEGNKG